MSKRSEASKTVRKSAREIPPASKGDLDRLRAAMQGSIDTGPAENTSAQELDSQLDLILRTVTIAVSRLGENRTNETPSHLSRVRCYSRRLAETLAEAQSYPGEVNSQFLQMLDRSSPLHDVGMLALPDLLRAGILANTEAG